MDKFSSPAMLTEFSEIPDQEDAWSDFISQSMDSSIAVVEQGNSNEEPAGGVGEGKSQYYNPLKKFSSKKPTTKDITWGGFPNVLEVLHKNDFYIEAEKLQTSTSTTFWNIKGEKIEFKFRPQDEYLEWHAEKNQDGKLFRVTFTCEGPEYWSALADGYPAPFYFNKDYEVPDAKGSKDKLLKLYHSLVSPNVQLEDLLFQEDLYQDESKATIAFRKGQYNPYNVWNTEKGIVHLTQPANTLGAEIDLAARGTIKRQDSKGNPITDVIKLICCSGYGGPNRNSDPTIGSQVNGLALAGYSVTLADPVGLYIDNLDTSGWTVPKPGTSERQPLEQKDYWHVIRPEPEQATKQKRILRAVFEVPADKGFTINDIQIDGVPIQYPGQIAKHITMKLTGAAIQQIPQGVPVLRCGFHCCKCNSNSDYLAAQIKLEDKCNPKPDPKDLRCSGGYEEAFPDLVAPQPMLEAGSKFLKSRRSR
ncbi:MAG TPA: hypothetical protein V6C85_28105 [Allocoleopsis sp.]